MYGKSPMSEFGEIPPVVVGSTTVPEEVPTHHGVVGNGVDSMDDRNVSYGLEDVDGGSDSICDFEGIDGVVYSDLATTDKVQKVFLHLGGCEFPVGQQGATSMADNTDPVPNQEQPQQGAAAPIPAAAVANPPPRSRNTRRFASSRAAPSSSSALMPELAGLYPFRTVQREEANTFIPDTQMMFHVLGICDQLMVSTESFTHHCPAWLPIVSQLYVSVLWLTHLLKVQIRSGHGNDNRVLLEDLLQGLHLDSCVIPGPIVPFFQAVTATKGPYEWSYDIVPCTPDFHKFYNQRRHRVKENHCRHIPFPAAMLDQLYRLCQGLTEEGEPNTYDNFLWYNNVFGVQFQLLHHSYKLGPQFCGSLHATRAQFNSAQRFWFNVFRRNFRRINLPNDRIINLRQFMGLSDTHHDAPQTSWFLQVSQAMQRYCRHFSESTTLSSVLPVGIGASAVYGVPRPNRAVNAWMYPRSQDLIAPPTSRIMPTRPIPQQLKVKFYRADFEDEEQAEHFAILTHTNIDWSPIPNTCNDTMVQITQAANRTGSYWKALFHRLSDPVTIAPQFKQVISSVYHKQGRTDED